MAKVMGSEMVAYATVPLAAFSDAPAIVMTLAKQRVGYSSRVEREYCISHGATSGTGRGASRGPDHLVHVFVTDDTAILVIDSALGKGSSRRSGKLTRYLRAIELSNIDRRDSLFTPYAHWS